MAIGDIAQADEYILFFFQTQSDLLEIEIFIASASTKYWNLLCQNAIIHFNTSHYLSEKESSLKETSNNRCEKHNKKKSTSFCFKDDWR